MEKFLKLLGVVGGIASFMWAVYQWRETQNNLHAQQAIEARKQFEQKEFETEKLIWQRQIEAQKPFLDRQLALYLEAVQVTAKLATSSDLAVWTKASERFWELYWGELAIVEDRDVASKMKAFGNALKEGKKSGSDLEGLALEIAHIMRYSVDRTWGINVWSKGTKGN